MTSDIHSDIPELYYAVSIDSDPVSESKLWYAVCDKNSENWRIDKAHALIAEKDLDTERAKLQKNHGCPVTIVGRTYALTELEIAFSHVSRNDIKYTRHYLDKLKDKNNYLAVLDQCYIFEKSRIECDDTCAEDQLEILQDILNSKEQITHFSDQDYEEFSESLITRNLLPSIFPVFPERKDVLPIGQELIEELNARDDQIGRTPQERIEDNNKQKVLQAEWRENCAQEQNSRSRINQLLLRHLIAA